MLHSQQLYQTGRVQRTDLLLSYRCRAHLFKDISPTQLPRVTLVGLYSGVWQRNGLILSLDKQTVVPKHYKYSFSVLGTDTVTQLEGCRQHIKSAACKLRAQQPVCRFVARVNHCIPSETFVDNNHQSINPSIFQYHSVKGCTPYIVRHL